MKDIGTALDIRLFKNLQDDMNTLCRLSRGRIENC